MLAAAQTALVIVVSFIWFCFRTITYLQGPRDGDLYAQNLGFQLVAYLIFWLPALLILNWIALRFERDWLSTLTGNNGSKDDV